MGACLPQAGNYSMRAAATTSAGGLKVAVGVRYRGPGCVGTPVGAPTPIGNTTTVCQASPGTAPQVYTTVLYSAAVGVATGTVVT